MTLVIVPCGKSKIWDRNPSIGATPARDAYTGNPFRLSRQYAEAVGDRWIILSAKYGFIEPHFQIQDYDVTFKRKLSRPVSVSTLRDQINAQRLTDYGVIVVLGGKEYRKVVEEAFRGLPVELRFPFSGLRLGEAMQSLKRALRPSR